MSCLVLSTYTPVVPSKTIPDSGPKWPKCMPVFRPKRRKNPTRWGASRPPPAGSRHSITENIGPGKTISDQFLGYKISTKQKEFFFLCLVTLEVRDSSALSIILSEDSIQIKKKTVFTFPFKRLTKFLLAVCSLGLTKHFFG